MVQVRILVFVGVGILLASCASSEALNVPSESSEPGFADFERRIDPFPVMDAAGRRYSHPFLGGLNVPRPQLVDIDGDGDPDLFVQEYTGAVMFFENTGTPEKASFTWRTDKYRDLDVGEWYRFADVDGDGDFDLMAEQPYSYIRYYVNAGTPDEPRFEMATDTLRADDGEPIFSDRQNIPNVTDIDCDALPDLFIGRLDGTVTRYEAVDAETDGVPVFRLVSERFENIEIVAQFGQPGQMNQPPMPNIPRNEPDGGGSGNDGGGVRGDSRVPKYQVPDTGYRVQMNVDLAGDGYFPSDGKVSAPIAPAAASTISGPRYSVYGTWYFVGGTRYSVLGTQRSRSARASWKRDGVSRGTGRHGANTMTFADIDGDGDKDLFWGDFFEPSLLRIENSGSCRTPVLRSEPRPFPPPDPIVSSGYNAPAFADIDADGDLDLFVGVLGGAFNPNRTVHAPFYFYEQTDDDRFRLRTRSFLDQIDVGSESFPALSDLDGDGDLDLLLSNKISSEETRSAVLTRYENTGTGAEPRFVQRDSIDLHPSYHYAPALGDLDGDGDMDMLVGTWNDGVAYYRKSTHDFELVDAGFVQLTRGSHSTPALVDIDGDGDLDLFVGETSGTINFFRNTGAAGKPVFELVTDEYLDIDVGRRSVPAFLDVDEDGDLDMVIGSEDRGLILYRNSGTAAEPRFVRDHAIAAEVPPIAAPAFADLDGDGHVDLLVGGAGGGLRYFEGSRR